MYREIFCIQDVPDCAVRHLEVYKSYCYMPLILLDIYRNMHVGRKQTLNRRS